MARPHVSEEVMDAIDHWVEPNLKTDIDKLSTDDKLRVLLEGYHDMWEYRQRQMNERGMRIVPPDLDAPKEAKDPEDIDLLRG